MAGKFYVLMMHTNPGAVLTTKPVTRKDAERTVRWQGAQVPSPTYPICAYNPQTRTFDEVDGERRSLFIHRGPYTEKAHAEFLASLPA